MKAQSTQYLHVHCNQKNLPNAWQIIYNIFPLHAADMGSSTFEST